MRKLMLSWVLPPLLDQAVKFYIKLNFTVGMHVDFIPSVLELLLSKTMVLLVGRCLVLRVFLLSGFRIVAAVGIGMYLNHSKTKDAQRLLACIALICRSNRKHIDGAVYGQPLLIQVGVPLHLLKSETDMHPL